MHLYIYLCILLCCNLKMEQRKHLSAIGSATLLHCAFTDLPLEQNHYLTYRI